MKRGKDYYEAHPIEAITHHLNHVDDALIEAIYAETKKERRFWLQHARKHLKGASYSHKWANFI